MRVPPRCGATRALSQSIVEHVARVGDHRVAPGAARDRGRAAVAQRRGGRRPRRPELLDVGLDRVALVA